MRLYFIVLLCVGVMSMCGEEEEEGGRLSELRSRLGC